MACLALALLLADLVVHLAVRRLRTPAKFLLMPLLLAFYLLRAPTPDPWIVAALTAAFVGDVFTIRLKEPAWFLAGLLAFLAGHVLWSAVFLWSTDRLSGVPAWFWLAALPYAALAVLVVRGLWRDIAGKRAGFAVYGGIIAFMSLMALSRVFSHGGAAFWLPFLGSLLFLASDGMLVFHVFHRPLKHGDLLVMGTYVAAESLIVLGLLATG